MRLWTGIASIALLLALATPAGAATVSVRSVYVDAYKGSGDYETTVTVDAAPGERNDITATAVTGGVLVSDAGTPLAAGADCSLDDPATARCTVKERYGPPHVVVHAGDGDDRLRAIGSWVELYGDEGDDVLDGTGEVFGRFHGGPGDDVLSGSGWFDGGPGADRITGSSDPTDRLSYEDRTAPVHVHLGDATTGNGEVGENDTITGIEYVLGGAGADELVGDDGPNQLEGNGGDDLIEGGGGDDRLYGGSLTTDLVAQFGTADTILGGDGADTIYSGRGGLADGGAGADQFTAAGPSSVVGGAGRDHVQTFNNAVAVDLADGEPDEVTCNPLGRPGAITLDAVDLAFYCTPAQLHGPPPPVVAIRSVDVRRSGRHGLLATIALSCPATVLQRDCVARATLLAGTSKIATTTVHQHPGTATTVRLRAGLRRTAALAVSTRDGFGIVRTERRTLHAR
jgi:Ca2+-binding RTX toxin-like protein